MFWLLDLYKGIDVWENKLHKWTKHWHALLNSRVTCDHCSANKSNECHLSTLLWKCDRYWFPEAGQDEWMHFVSKSRYQYVFVIGFHRCLEMGCDAMQFGKRHYNHNGANTFTHYLFRIRDITQGLYCPVPKTIQCSLTQIRFSGCTDWSPNIMEKVELQFSDSKGKVILKVNLYKLSNLHKSTMFFNTLESTLLGLAYSVLENPCGFLFGNKENHGNTKKTRHSTTF